ncbi:MAG TPA: hypothetical protein VGD62_06295, partial [Acidobacteriaceae bacterium]
MSATVPPLQLLPGPSPTPTQIMPICAAKIESWMRVESLSPFCDAELVKPAANLSFQVCAAQGVKQVSRNALKIAETLP